jgi:glycerophosphoryl diester phosphodiesterase
MKILISTICILLSFAFLARSQQFDIQGHRGCRGLMPENSIPGFLAAIDIGVTTLEMDVVISADGKVVVSHDPYFSSDFCVNELGLPISKKEERNIAIYDLDYEDVMMFDCGIVGNPNFPGQKRISIAKPLLCDVIEQCEKYVNSRGSSPISYNIELKSRPSGDNVEHPEPELFTRLVYESIKDLVPAERLIIQSFDPRILQFWKLKYPENRLSYLVSSPKEAEKTIELLGFKPDIFSPNFKMLKQKIVDEWHANSVSVIPWTVNEKSDMKKVMALGVDGLITDYPDRYFEFLGEK